MLGLTAEAASPKGILALLAVPIIISRKSLRFEDISPLNPAPLFFIKGVH